MVEKSTIILGEEPSSKDLEEIESLKIDIVEQLREADVKFPVKNKDQLARIYPKGTRKSCVFRGKEVSIHDLIPLIDNSYFPIENAGDAATALTSACLLK